jgi:HK97 family phage major capsid protein
MNLIQEKQELRTKIAALTAKTSLTATERSQLTALIAQAADIRATEERQTRAASAVASVKKEQPVAVAENKGSEFRTKFLSEQYRTYVPLSTSVDGQLIPSDIEVRIKNLMLADGPLFAGSPLVTSILTSKLQSSKIAANDDTGSTGVIVDENTPMSSDYELTSGLSSVSVGGSSQRFSTGILLASVSLAEDVEQYTTFANLVARSAGARLSRIQNATNLTALKTSLAANSSAAVAAVGTSIAASDIYALIAAVGAPYRIGGVFVMSKAKQAQIGALTDTTGKRVFPHILESAPTLVNYPVHIIGAAANTDCLFGDYSFLVAKYAPIEMRVMKERFRPEGYYGFVMSERAEMKWTVASGSDSPVKYLSGLTS